MSGEGWRIPEQTDNAGVIEPDLSNLLPIPERVGVEPFTMLHEGEPCSRCGAPLAQVTIHVPAVLRALGNEIAAAVDRALEEHAPEYCPTCSVEWLVQDAARAAWRVRQRPGAATAPCTLDRCVVNVPHLHTGDLKITSLSPLVARYREDG